MLTREEEIVISLRRISQGIDNWSRHLLHTYGLTSPQLATLREIMTGKHQTTGGLATALHISQATVTGILDRLQQRRLIVREHSLGDRRSVLVTVTEEGRQLASNAPPLLSDNFRQELRVLPIDGQEQILHTLKRVAEMMHAPEVADLPYLCNN